MVQTEARQATIPVYFLLRESVLTLDLIGPAEVLRYANRFAEKSGCPPYFELHFISAHREVATSVGLALTGIEALPQSLPDNAMLILSGCVDKDDDFSNPADQAAVRWLQQHYRQHHRLVCICTGALLAAYAGFLNKRKCTTHHSHINELRGFAPQADVLENRIFVEDGTIYTSAGVTTGIDLALHIVAQIAGHACSASVARSLVVYLRRTGSDPQLSPWLTARNHIHPAVHRVQNAVIKDPAQDWSVAQLADIACTSERHLTRLFREHTGDSLIDYIHRIRIALARDLLAQSPLDIERVAEKSGFHSGRQLRRVWKKFEAHSPSAHRESVGAHAG